METTDNRLSTSHDILRSRELLGMPPPPSSDDLDPDDDAELELEPPDEEVLAGERRRAEEAIAAVQSRVNVDEVWREEERRLNFDDLSEWMHEIRFRFQVKHLLILTAVVAVLVSVARYSLGAMVVLAVLAAVGGSLAFLNRKEKEHHATINQRRRQRPAPDGSQPPPVDERKASDRPAIPFVQQLSELCTPRELIVTSVIAVVLLGLLGLVFGTAVMATCLGLLALGGLGLQIVGIDLPRLVTVAWCVLLVIYVLVSILMAVSSIA
jgi:hypothetical protein